MANEDDVGWFDIATSALISRDGQTLAEAMDLLSSPVLRERLEQYMVRSVRRLKLEEARALVPALLRSSNAAAVEAGLAALFGDRRSRWGAPKATWALAYEVPDNPALSCSVERLFSNADDDGKAVWAKMAAKCNLESARSWLVEQAERDPDQRSLQPHQLGAPLAGFDDDRSWQLAVGMVDELRAPAYGWQQLLADMIDFGSPSRVWTHLSPAVEAWKRDRRLAEAVAHRIGSIAGRRPVDPRWWELAASLWGTGNTTPLGTCALQILTRVEHPDRVQRLFELAQAQHVPPQILRALDAHPDASSVWQRVVQQSTDVREVVAAAKGLARTRDATAIALAKDGLLRILENASGAVTAAILDATASFPSRVAECVYLRVLEQLEASPGQAVGLIHRTHPQSGIRVPFADALYRWIVRHSSSEIDERLATAMQQADPGDRQGAFFIGLCRDCLAERGNLDVTQVQTKNRRR